MHCIQDELFRSCVKAISSCKETILKTHKFWDRSPQRFQARVNNYNGSSAACLTAPPTRMQPMASGELTVPFFAELLHFRIIPPFGIVISTPC